MHALTGMWIANIDHSRRDPNHQFHRATMRFEVVDDRVSVVYGGVNASGRQEEGAQTFHTDGQERAVPEASEVVAISTLEPRGSFDSEEGQCGDWPRELRGIRRRPDAHSHGLRY